MNDTKNTMPELYDENPAGVEKPSQEEVLMNEKDILRGLIEAGNLRAHPDTQERSPEI